MSELRSIVERSVAEMRPIVREATGIADANVSLFGAVDIDPRHCVIWITVQTDAQKAKIDSDVALLERLKDVLVGNGYPNAVRSLIYLGAESQETVDRESGGNWWQHFK